VRGEIDLEEYERRVEIFLSGEPFVVLEPGEQVVTADDPLAVEQRRRRAERARKYCEENGHAMVEHWDSATARCAMCGEARS
jgi:hypothetical protein